MDTTEVQVTRLEGTRRIGFTSDTHVKEAADFPQAAMEAFKGLDLIVHCGHYGSPALLDHLGTVAPVLATTSALDERMSGEALAGPYADRVGGYNRVIEAGGVAVGVMFDLSGKGFDIKPEDPPIELGERKLDDVLREKFGRPVDVVVYANTHIDRVSSLQGVLLVNPGSPNLHTRRAKGELGTVAVLTCTNGIADVEIVDLRSVAGG
jgi:uncharacterized protein